MDKERVVKFNMWRVVVYDSGVINVASADFEHDVSLGVSGDWATQEEELAYARKLCAILNASDLT